MSRSAGGQEYARARNIAISTAYEDVLRDPNVNAVILCSPHTAHFQQIIQAAAAKKHVFCEKPLTLTRRDAEEAVAACNANRVTLGVGHERRFEPAILEMRRLVNGGALGTLLQIETNFSQDKFLGLAPDNWRLSATEAPAGPMTATGIHMLDLAVSFLGPAERVMASVRQLGSSLVNGDTLGALIMFKSGANTLLSAMLATPYDGRFAIYGTGGWAELRDQSHPDAPTGSRLTVCRAGDIRSSIDYKPELTVRANLEAFADAAEGRAVYPIAQQDMIATIAAFESISKSAMSGKLEQV